MSDMIVEVFQGKKDDYEIFAKNGDIIAVQDGAGFEMNEDPECFNFIAPEEYESFSAALRGAATRSYNRTRMGLKKEGVDA